MGSKGLKPEEKARVKIDRMFEDAGWKVVDRDEYTPTLTAAAIREGLLNGNRAACFSLLTATTLANRPKASSECSA